MKFTVRANEQQELRELRAIKGEVSSIEVDFAPWADDNGAVTSATWSVIRGNATIGSSALASNVASAVLTTAESGESTIEVKGINATYTKPIRVRVLAREPGSVAVYDYGYRWA